MTAPDDDGTWRSDPTAQPAAKTVTETETAHHHQW